MKLATARDLALIAAFVLVLLAPFLDKAYTIDDPLFLWLAKHIQAAPLDPFGRAAPDVFRVLAVQRPFRFDVDGPREER